MRVAATVIAAIMSLVAPSAFPDTLSPAQQQLRTIYQELVETNTTNSTGSCTMAVTQIMQRLKAVGFANEDLHLVIPPGAPAKGNLVARLHGDGSSRPLLLLAHVDVVEANRADWRRDPFKLIEENGVFYGRGAADDKAMAAVLVTNMIAYKQEGLRPKRDLILALTCDEETVPSPFDGADYLLTHHRQLIDAELALSEGAYGLLDQDGKPLYNGIQAGEKIYQSFRLEVTSTGGHSSLPQPDNAIYRLAEGLGRLGKYQFPFQLTPVTRGYFEHMARTAGGQDASDARAILSDPPDAAALRRLYASNATNNAIVRTTCVTTTVKAGEADNALPQRAQANVNCRIMPGTPIDAVKATLVRVLADPHISVTQVGEGVASPLPPLPPALMQIFQAATNDVWPGVPVVPILVPYGTDGRFLNRAGIPTYGTTGQFNPPAGNNMHGVNEALLVKSLYDSQLYLDHLVRRLAQ